MNELTIDRLREVLDYNKNTGVFTWKKSARGSYNLGRVAGCVCNRGYRHIGIDGFQYFAHRIAWFFVHGKWPDNEIDHINGVRDDNRIANLRDANRSQNNENQRRPHVRNSSGFLGVSWHKRDKIFQAQIKVAGKMRSLGNFRTAEDAHNVYVAAKRQLHAYNTI